MVTNGMEIFFCLKKSVFSQRYDFHTLIKKELITLAASFLSHGFAIVLMWIEKRTSDKTAEPTNS